MKHEGQWEWPQPLPIAGARRSEIILAYFGPNRAGWYRCRWDDMKGFKHPKGFWNPIACDFGVRWARQNQPRCYVPLPPIPVLMWSWQE